MKIELDPNNAFEGVKKSRLLEATGLLPYFVKDAFDLKPQTAQECYDSMVTFYGFGDYSSAFKGEVDKEGRYISPEDAPLDPLLVMESYDQKVTVYIYQYAIIAVKDDEGITVTSRMD